MQATNTSLDLSSASVKSLLDDIRRSKWLDNEVLDLGLNRVPSLGIEKAEVITALCSLLHGPLSKQSSEAFASVKSIVQLITSGGNSRFCVEVEIEIVNLLSQHYGRYCSVILRQVQARKIAASRAASYDP